MKSDGLEGRLLLRAISGPASGKVWLVRSVARIGRYEGAEIPIDDNSVSRVHAEVRLTPLGWRLMDKGSTNGTLVNGTRVGVAQWPLRRSDMIGIGGVTLAVEELLEPALAPPAKTAPARDDLGLFQGLNLWVEATTRTGLHDALVDVAREREKPGADSAMLMALLETSRHLVHLDREDDFLGSVLDDAVRVLRAQGGAIVLAEGTPPRLKPRVQVERDGTRGRPRAYSQSLAERVFSSGSSALCRTLEDDPNLANIASVMEGNMASILCVLLRTPRGSLGVLHLDRSSSELPFGPADLAFADAMAAQVSAGIEGAMLVRRQREAFLETVSVLGQVIELRDAYTGGHTMRVTAYAARIGEAMRLPADQLELLRLGAPLHDIGKIGINDAILRKQTALTPDEQEVMRGHTVLGDQILRSHPGLDKVAAIARSHHERHDGQGYPDRLAGDSIPLLARIVAVADAFDAITTDRPYRARMTVPEALCLMGREAGRQFDPQIFEAFLAVASERAPTT